VPNLRILPPEVTGLVVPGLYPYNAVESAPLDDPVIALFVPGRWKPEIGRPETDTGLTICEIPPLFALLKGRWNEVPGRGAVAI
jgi:hypothetical protein